MDNFATAEEQIAFDKLREKFHEVNVVAQTDLATVQKHVNYTCQKAFFKCTYECYDRCTRMEDISNCVENCRIPLTEAQEIFAKEKAVLQEKLNASFVACLNKYEEAKLQQKPGALGDFISCTEQSYQESVNMMPHLANKLKACYGLKDNDSF